MRSDAVDYANVENLKYHLTSNNLVILLQLYITFNN